MGKLRTREIFESATVSLVAVERVDMQRHVSNIGCHVYGSIEPIAVIVHSMGRVYALDTTGNSMDLDQLERDLDDSGVSLS